MGTFRILSLDGGGIRGAFSAAFLAELERELGIRMADHFDLIAGTSTGGIIGIGLALGAPAERIENFFQSKGRQVFQKRQPARTGLVKRVAGWAWDGVASQAGGWGGVALRVASPVFRWVCDGHLARFGLDFNALFQTRYESNELGRTLQEVLGPKTLESAETRIIVPAVDLTSGKPVMFKSPHLPDACSRDKAFSAVQIALATAAAPTYFPHVTIRDGSAYCDGGLWANNPILLAVAEAERIFSSELPDRASGLATGRELQVLSIGTGRGRYSVVPPDSSAGLIWWGSRILDVMLLSQAAGTNSAAQFILGDRLHRVDFDLPDRTWTLDNVDHIDKLIHIGRDKAHEYLAHLRPLFVEKRLMSWPAASKAEATSSHT